MSGSVARKAPPLPEAEGAVTSRAGDALVRRHLRFGWWSLLCFLALGLGLEVLHGFKARFYLDVSNETRRLMWTLAHAHGALLGLVHVGFAFTLNAIGDATGGWRRAVSICLIGASVLLPGGFFLGGLWIYGGDPGRGILLVPAGAGLLMAGVLLVALRTTRQRV